MAVDSGTYTPETIQRRYKLAEQLLSDPKKPITHWAEGLNELAKGVFGGMQMRRAEEAERGGERAQSEALARLLNGSGAPTDLAPQAATPTSAPANAPSGDLPRGLRNNNPLNIEAGGFTEGQPGFSGSDGRFARFETPEQGVGAANKLLDVYQNKHGLNTVSGIVNRWAPAGDGNNVNSYAANVARQLGIDPNAPIPPEMRPQLIAAMGQHENGRPIGNVAQALNGTQVAQAQPQQQPQGQPSMPAAPSDNRARVAAMLNDPNPYVRKMGQTLATNIIQKQMEGEKPTDDIRDYEYAKRQGFKGSLLDFIATKRAGAGEYGLTPIWGTGPDGKPAFIQPGKSGKAVQGAVPEGFNIARDPVKVDAGTDWILLDPQTRQPVGRVPKNIEGKEAAEERGKATGQAQVGLPNALAQADQTLKTIDQIRAHPGRKSAFGVGRMGWVPGIPGSEQAGFVSMVDQLQGKTFLQAFESLKGGGAITEIEGKKAEGAIARLKRTQNDTDFDVALKDLEDVVRAGMERARAKAGGAGQMPPAATAPPPAAGATPSIDDLLKKYGPK